MLIPRLSSSDQQKSALHWSADHKNEQLVKLLLDSGADPGMVDSLGLNCLHAAIASNSAVCVEMILRKHKHVSKYTSVYVCMCFCMCVLMCVYLSVSLHAAIDSNSVVCVSMWR